MAWHWQHFSFDPSTRALPVEVARQPFFTALSFLYRNGWVAVDLFFVLSGFVFCFLYARAIADRGIEAREFALRRIARLYPLHLATFAAVTVLQLAYMRGHSGVPFVYPMFDAYHAVLNLAGISSWGLERGYSFNGPFWSVSVELLLYLVFFVACRWVSASFVSAAILAGVGVYMLGVNWFIGRGLYSFFIGCLAAHAYYWLKDRARADVLRWGSAVACVVGWIIAGYLMRWNVRLERLFPPAFALTIFALAANEARWGNAATRLAPLGDMSYGIYLWHFPLQLAFVLAAASAGAPADYFYRPATFVTFIVTLLAVSWLGFRYLESPARAGIRRLSSRSQS